MLSKLRATRAFTYGTRRLVAGDVFEASARDTRLLLATKKVQAVREAAAVPPPPPAVKAKIEAAVAPASKPPATVPGPVAPTVGGMTTSQFSGNDKSPAPAAEQPRKKAAAKKDDEGDSSS